MKISSNYWLICALFAAVKLVAADSRSALILYDGPVAAGDGVIAARQAANLLDHFGYTATLEPVLRYSAGQADHYGVVFVFGMANKTAVPAALLGDLARRDQTTCWVNQYLDQLTTNAAVTARLGFAVGEYDDDTGYNIVTYRTVALPKTDPELNRVSILDSNKVQVLATAGSEDDSAPFVIRSGRFWYFTGPIFSYTVESDQSLVFADLLHDILGVDHATERRALVRVEDVSADSDPDDLRRVADLLAARHVPFQIALIPVFRDPGNHIELTLTDRPEVVEALHYMVARGGTIIMHGVTHQLHGVSGDDFEFWDRLTSRTTADGSLAALRPKLERGFEECFRAGLFPVVFETPHYAASQEHYRSLATVFSHCYDRRMVTDSELTQQSFPYLSTDITGQRIIPENLGYIEAEKPDATQIIDAAHRLLVVRDPIASVFFHPFMPVRYLEEVLTALARDGYQFVSIKDFGPSAALGEYAVTTAARSLTLTPHRPFLRTISVDDHGQASETVQPVSSGKPVTLQLQPPAGGLVAVETVTHAPVTPRRLTWLERVQVWLTGRDPRNLLAAPGRARQALIAGHDPAFESFLQVHGLPVQFWSPGAPLPSDAFVFVPAGDRLAPAAQKQLAVWIENGGRAVLEGHSALAEQLGFEYDGRTFVARKAQDFLMPDVPITWVHPATIERFTPPPINVTLIEESFNESPLVVAARVGAGVVIYLAGDFDPETELGYLRLPFLFQHLRQRFGLEPAVTASGVEFYFDPGFREQAPLEKLVTSWHAEGVRAVYAAAWHFYPKWKFDYTHFIQLCHAQGIAVYAWLELPLVSDQFWDAHPEWREKTAAGGDGVVGWRKFMNLASDPCRAATLDFVDDLLRRYDWDGVNIAELCFDSGDGYREPANYIPMNADVRSRFQREAGFDPMQLFDPRSPQFWETNRSACRQWETFRAGLTRDWLAAVLDRVHRHHLDVIVTALDSLNSSNIVAETGADIRDVLALMDRYPFTIQVEDPREKWGDAPTRYRDYAARYQPLVRDPRRLMFDINVVKDRPAGLAPTALPGGTELLQTARAAASAGNGRVAIYSESTVWPEDRALLPFALAGTAPVVVSSNTTVITANQPVRFQFSVAREAPAWWRKLWRGTTYEPWPVPLVDGQPWPCGTKGRVLLGPGRHTITGVLPKDAADRSWIKDITATFTNLQMTEQGFALDYESPRRAWVLLARPPSTVVVDEETLPATAVQGRGVDWTVVLPAGQHHVVIEQNTPASLLVDHASRRASRSIVWLGSRAVIFLAALYGWTRLHRLWVWWRRRYV